MLTLSPVTCNNKGKDKVSLERQKQRVINNQCSAECDNDKIYLETYSPLQSESRKAKVQSQDLI